MILNFKIQLVSLDISFPVTLWNDYTKGIFASWFEVKTYDFAFNISTSQLSAATPPTPLLEISNAFFVVCWFFSKWTFFKKNLSQITHFVFWQQ